jgi:hypothetical protein
VSKPDNDILLEQNVMKALLYFNIFNYPLKAKEVFSFLHTNGVSELDVANTLIALVEKKAVYNSVDLYSVQNEGSIFSRRIKGNLEASKILPFAERRAKFIGKFPFVRSVMASGSLSKDYMDEQSDLDFFIITAPGRLWISRMLLVIYKRLFLKNSHKQFCVNYFIDSDHLEIEERNLFTATELATVVPFYGKKYYSLLHTRNEGWLRCQFPNFRPKQISSTNEESDGFVKICLESMFNLFGAGFIDRLFMKATERRWKKIYASYQNEDFKVAFKTKKYASKNHPRNFQKKVIELYQKQLSAFQINYEPLPYE